MHFDVKLRIAIRVPHILVAKRFGQQHIIRHEREFPPTIESCHMYHYNYDMVEVLPSVHLDFARALKMILAQHLQSVWNYTSDTDRARKLLEHPYDPITSYNECLEIFSRWK